MDEYWIRLSPLLAIMAALIGLLFWWRWRSDRKEERAHVDALTALAGTLGGRVVDPAESGAWSAGLLAPMRGETDGLVNRLGTVSRPRFDTALEFRRGEWSVRVGEASVKKVAQNGTRTDYEHRIEVATSRLAPMRISRRNHGGTNSWGRPRPADDVSAQGGELVREVPVTVAAEGGRWHRVAFPPGPFDAQFAVFTGDPAAVSGLLDPETAEYLLDQAHGLPSVLHFEAGLVFGTRPGRIGPGHTLDAVDAVLGLLDRMGVAPARPPSAG